MDVIKKIIVMYYFYFLVLLTCKELSTSDGFAGRNKNTHLSKHQITFCCSSGEKAIDFSFSCAESFQNIVTESWTPERRDSCFPHFKRCCLETRKYSLCDIGIWSFQNGLNNQCSLSYVNNSEQLDKNILKSCCDQCQLGSIGKNLCMLGTQGGEFEKHAFKTCCNDLTGLSSFNPCPTGYRLNPNATLTNGTLCEEINECLFDSPVCKKTTDVCTNTYDGSYRCVDFTCPASYVPLNDGSICYLEKAANISKSTKKNYYFALPN